MAVKKRKFAVFVTIIMMVLSLLAGCGGKEAQTTDKLAEVVYNNGAAPQTMDPALQTGVPEMNIALATFEGLTRIGPNNEPVPGIAESWDISPDGKVYTFHLRDAKWDDGKPVTAYDFEYAWKRIIDPKLVPKPSEYAYMLTDYIKNAAEYNNPDNTTVTADDVGVKAVDEKTLVVELNAPVPFFLQVLAHASYFPVRKDIVEADPEGWSMKPETHVGNGPFDLVSIEGNVFKFKKNENYWDAANVKLNTLAFTSIEEQSTALTMFENGELDLNDDPPIPDMQRLKKEGKLQYAPEVSVYYYIVNCERKPFNDVRVRQALAYAIDRKAITDEIKQGGEIPATGIVPPGLNDAQPGSDFRNVGGDLFPVYDPEKAKKLLAEAGYPDGKGFPKFQILYNTNESHQIIAEAIAEMWKNNLGLDVTLTNQEWGVYLDTRVNGDFDIARAGWATDYLDPMSFISLQTSQSGNNHSNWSNKEYDRLVAIANSTDDPKVRMQAMHDAEKLLMKEMPVIPIYYYSNPYLLNPKVKGVYISPLTIVDFKWAYVEE